MKRLYYKWFGCARIGHKFVPWEGLSFTVGGLATGNYCTNCHRIFDLKLGWDENE